MEKWFCLKPVKPRTVFWREIPSHFPFARLDEFVIMPDHLHGIIIIDKGPDFENGKDKTEAPGIDHSGVNPGKDKAMPCLNCLNVDKPALSRFQNQGKGTISAIIGSYKSICTKTINKMRSKDMAMPRLNCDFSWQPGFYDHIIRSEEELNRVRNYIKSNPENWKKDENIKKELS